MSAKAFPSKLESLAVCVRHSPSKHLLAAAEPSDWLIKLVQRALTNKSKVLSSLSIKCNPEAPASSLYARFPAFTTRNYVNLSSFLHVYYFFQSKFIVKSEKRLTWKIRKKRKGEIATD